MRSDDRFGEEQEDGRARLEAEARLEPLPPRLQRLFSQPFPENQPFPEKKRSWPFRAAKFTIYWGGVTAVWFAVILVSAVTVYSTDG